MRLPDVDCAMFCPSVFGAGPVFSRGVVTPVFAAGQKQGTWNEGIHDNNVRAWNYSRNVADRHPGKYMYPVISICYGFRRSPG
jgi:hypothetical protein